MNLTRTRLTRTVVVGAMLGMTIGLPRSGLTAASETPEPPTTEPVAAGDRSAAEPGRTSADRTSRGTRAPDHRATGGSGAPDD
jgi:hypothetical protein